MYRTPSREATMAGANKDSTYDIGSDKVWDNMNKGVRYVSQLGFQG